MTTSARNPSWRQLTQDAQLLLAFGLGTGLSPFAPGTMGTVLAVVIYPLLALLPMPAYLVILVVFILFGVAICDGASKKLGVHDHSGIVIDEVAGLWLAMAGFPASWPWLLGGFVLFRFFDIVKPWPISWLDRRVSGGLGIMVDDMVAGCFAWVVLYCARYILE